MSARHSPVRRLSESIESKDDLNLPIEKGNYSYFKNHYYFLILLIVLRKNPYDQQEAQGLKVWRM